ncbi:phosphoribosylanthranilate isomerase [Lactococcus kimchii]|nr:phosphoribosylanthranilate isomerase [Lactococcus sp. S-13]
MKIKICGLSTKAAVDTACQAGATHLGFILSKSRRQISPEKIAEITCDVPQNIQKVGVFVNEPLVFVKNAVKLGKLDIVQLHGSEDMTYISALDLPVIKAISSLQQSKKYEGVTLLFDSPKGGSGETFDWKTDLSAVETPYFIAGGLTPENVATALHHYPNAYGVDVSSGVETKGVKDLSKIEAFIKNANFVASQS